MACMGGSRLRMTFMAHNVRHGLQVLNELVTAAPMCCTADTVALLENPLKQAIGVRPTLLHARSHAR